MSKYEDDYEYDDYSDEASAGKSLKGYKVVVALLAVILVAVSGLYFYQSHQLRRDFAIERDTLVNRMLIVQNDFANLETTNLALGDSIVVERMRTDSVLQALQKERNLSRATIRRYEGQLATMRLAMENYIYQIDSLGKLNARLIDANLGMRRQVATERQRADMAEERADENEIKIRQAARILARDIGIVLLNKNDNEVTRVRRADRIRVDATLSANSIANPGLRDVYTRITGPDGYVIANPEGSTFDFEGEPLVYTEVRRDVDYRNEDLEIGIFCRVGGISEGTHRVEIYLDGMLAGTREVLLK